MHRQIPSNNFNKDFYRLCSDTFNCGSDANLNQLSANISCYEKKDEANHNTNIHSCEFNQNLHTLGCQNLKNTLSAHVSSLFDQWLINSTSTK